MDNMGAHGGGPASHGDGADTFPDVFSEEGDKSRGAMGGSAGSGGGATPKKTSSIVHNFQSGPNLQLPTAAHRQSAKHSEGGSTWPAGASPLSAGTHPPVASSSAFGGARSKVRDKKNRRGSSGGAGDEGSMSEFDPLSAQSSGRRSSRDKVTSRRAINIQNTQNWVDHPGKHDSPRSIISDGSHGASSPLPINTSSEGAVTVSGLPVGPIGPSRSGRAGSRDSGIDIWVNTNGQMSGSSSSGRASLDSSNTGGSPRMLSQQGSAGRASLDSNLQRLQHNLTSRGSGSMMSSPDSGLQLGSSQDTTRPLEIVSPLFSHLNSPDSRGAAPKSTANTGPGNSSGSSSTPTGDLLGLSISTSSQVDTVRTETARENSPLMLLDSHFDGQAGIAEPALRRTVSLDKQQGKKMPPSIQVTNFKSIARVSSEEKGSNSGSERESLEGDIARPFEQQALNLNERRLSSAITLGDAFTLGTETDLVDLGSNPGEIPPGTLKDLSISFNDAVSIIEEEEPLFTADSDSARSESEPFFTVKSDSEPVPALNLDGKDDVAPGASAPGKTVLGVKSHHREDSSGSNQSISSLKFLGEGQDRMKEQAADNMSIASDEKVTVDEDKEDFR